MTGKFIDMYNGFKIPVIGLGTFAINDEKELEDSLDAAFEVGYRHLDTATLYRNEHLIGRVLQKWFSTGKFKREDIFVTTKLPWSSVHPDRVENSIKKSLESLQLDYVDLYLIHVPVCIKPTELGGPMKDVQTEPTDLIAVWKKMEEQVDAGLAKTIGISNFNKEQIGRILKIAKIKPAALQVELHVYLQQKELVKFAQDNGLVVVSYESLGNPGMNQFLTKVGKSPRTQLNLLQDPTVTKIAHKHKKTSAQVLLKFLLQNNIAVIPKSSNTKRIRENFDLFDFDLDNEDLEMLESLNKGEDGRLSTFAQFGAFTKHPEYPFPIKK